MSHIVIHSQLPCSAASSFFFFNDTATTEIYTLSLHDALPISGPRGSTRARPRSRPRRTGGRVRARAWERSGCPEARRPPPRSEEHTSELQSQSNLVCRLLLEKKKHRRPQIQPATAWRRHDSVR